MTLRPSNRRAFTLIEMVVVLGIMAVMVVIGIGSTRKQMPRFRAVGVAKQLQADMMLLRNTSAEQGVETRLLLVEADTDYTDPDSAQAGAWKLQVGDRSLASTTWTDLGNATMASTSLADGSQDAVPQVSLAPWAALAGPGSTNSDAIVFSPRGFVTNPDGDFGTDGYITVTVVNKESWRHGIEDHIDLKVARSGNVTMVTSLGQRDAGTVASGEASASGGS